MRALLERVLLLAAACCAVFVTARPPATALQQLDSPLLPSPALLRALLPGHAELVADFYWIQLTNQVGNAATADEYLRAYDYADLITDLAPQFVEVYQFAGAIIPFNRGRDTWVNGEESLKIIRKGLAYFPDDANLRRYLVFDLMFLEHDYKAAADEVKKLSTMPGTPAVLAQLATRLYAQAGDFDDGLELTKTLESTAASDEQRQFFAHRAKQIETERLLASVDAAAWAFFRREGKQPTSVAQLLGAGDLAVPPTDPMGGEIFLDAFGRARTTAENFRLELYEDSSKTMAKDSNERP